MMTTLHRQRIAFCVVNVTAGGQMGGGRTQCAGYVQNDKTSGIRQPEHG